MVVNSDAAPFVVKGKTMLSASEIKGFEKGAAVDVRGGVREILTHEMFENLIHLSISHLAQY